MRESDDLHDLHLYVHLTSKEGMEGAQIVSLSFQGLISLNAHNMPQY